MPINVASPNELRAGPNGTQAGGAGVGMSLKVSGVTEQDRSRGGVVPQRIGPTGSACGPVDEDEIEVLGKLHRGVGPNQLGACGPGC